VDEDAVVISWSELAVQVGLEAAADQLAEAAARARHAPRLMLEAGIADKLRGHIDDGLAALRTAAATLPREDTDGRQRALFVLALTWSDLGRPEAALQTLDDLVTLDPTSSWAEAARGYAEEWRAG
jgi:hypothetical protein